MSKQKAQIYLERSKAYSLLATVFLEIPTADSVGLIRKTFYKGTEEKAPFIEEMLEEIAIDRTRLMRGLTPNGPTPPYQSAFSGTQASKTLQELMAFYTRCSFILNENAQEAPDYLGVELAFAAQLCKKLASLCEAESYDEELDSVSDLLDEFIRDFMSPLVFAYTEVVATHANTKYCRQFAEVLKEFIQSELDYI